jgi:hypothetical protein
MAVNGAGRRDQMRLAPTDRSGCSARLAAPIQASVVTDAVPEPAIAECGKGPKAPLRHPAQRGMAPVASASRTAALSTDFAAWASQSSGVWPRSSRASRSAPCLSKTRIVCTKPALTT